VIKQENTLRRRLPLAKFLEVSKSIVNRWSKERDTANLLYCKPFVTTPNVSTADYRKAYEWLKNPARITYVSGDDYFSRPKDSLSKQLLSSDIQIYRQSLTFSSYNFDSYYSLVNGIWHTRLNRSDFKLSTCTCPSYFRDYICKHILGVAAMTKINPIPNEAKAVCIEQKAPRGRPAKAKKALEYQAPVTQIPVSEAQSPVAKSSNKRKAQEAEIEEPPKKRGKGRPPKPKPVSEPESEQITEPSTSNLLIIRPRRNATKKTTKK
jgi:hypothetical protein